MKGLSNHQKKNNKERPSYSLPLENSFPLINSSQINEGSAILFPRSFLLSAVILVIFSGTSNEGKRYLRHFFSREKVQKCLWYFIIREKVLRGSIFILECSTIDQWQVKSIALYPIALQFSSLQYLAVATKRVTCTTEPKAGQKLHIVLSSCLFCSLISYF